MCVSLTMSVSNLSLRQLSDNFIIFSASVRIRCAAMIMRCDTPASPADLDIHVTPLTPATPAIPATSDNPDTYAQLSDSSIILSLVCVL